MPNTSSPNPVKAFFIAVLILGAVLFASIALNRAFENRDKYEAGDCVAFQFTTTQDYFDEEFNMHGTHDVTKILSVTRILKTGEVSYLTEERFSGNYGERKVVSKRELNNDLYKKVDCNIQTGIQ
jgi:hypothetical protein